MISISNIDTNGIEHMTICVRCCIDQYKICKGTRIILENNHRKNSWNIYSMVGSRYGKELDNGKEETLSKKEFEQWLETHEYSEDEHECARARKEHNSQL